MNYQSSDKLAPKRQNGFNFDSSDWKPPAKVPCTKKRVRNRLQMKPDGSIVCEVVEEIDDEVPKLDDEKLIPFELGEVNEIDPLKPVEDFKKEPLSPNSLQVSNIASIPVKVEVKTEDEIKIEDDEVFPMFKLTNPFTESKFEAKHNFDNSDGTEDDEPDTSNIPVVGISEPIKPFTTRSDPLSQLQRLVTRNSISEKQPVATNSDVVNSAKCSPMHVANHSDGQEQQPVMLPDDSYNIPNVSSLRSVDRPTNTDQCPCIIETLLEVPFADEQWTADDRKDIVIKGKPTKFTVRFEGSVVLKLELINKWLTGCSARDELYCWPCLLFHPKSLWVSKQSLLSHNSHIHDISPLHQKSVSMLDRLEVHFSKLQVTKKIEKPTPAGYSSAGVGPKPLPHQDLTEDTVQPVIKTYSCVVTKLINNDFSDFDEQERDSILLLGRPRPSLGDLMLNREYDMVDWLTASLELKKLFCWPCLLGPQNSKSGVWTKFGFCDFKFLDHAVFRHQATQLHMDAYLQLKLLESSVKKKTKCRSTRVVLKQKKQLDFFKYVVDVTCFLKQTKNISTSIDDFVDVLKLISFRDEKLKYLFKEKSLKSDEAIRTSITPYLKPISTSLQSLMFSKMKEELKKTHFVSLILDDTHDKLGISYVSVILRYTTETGDPRERFVKFITVPEDRQIRNFQLAVKSLMKDLDCEKKIVGYTYGGSVVCTSSVKLFNDEMKRMFPYSIFFHYKEHNLWRIILQSLSHLKCSKDLVINLTEMSNFFENTPKAKASFLSTLPMQHSEWDFSSGLVFIIVNYYNSLINFFDVINSSATKLVWSNKVIAQANEFLEFLLCFSNRFTLVLLSRIFADVDYLQKLLKRKKFDSKAVSISCRNTVEKIRCNKFEDIFIMACTSSLIEPRVTKPGNRNIYKEIHQQVINDVSLKLFLRISDLEKWEFFDCLTTSDSCIKYLNASRVRLSSSSSVSLTVCPLIDCQRLKTQLLLVCNNDHFFGHENLDDLIRCLHDYDMVDIVDELYKFLMFIRTVPILMNDSMIPKIHKINDFIKGKKDLDNSDALMWIEKELLTELQTEADFHDRVIDDVVLDSKTDV